MSLSEELPPLIEELQPFIHANYRSRPDDSAYVGFSSSGLFGLFALFNHPDMFERYVCVSPPIFRSNKGILQDEQSYAQSHDDLPARLFLSVGEREEIDDPFLAIRPSDQFVTNVNILAKILQERNYPGLELTTHVFEGETHLSVFPAAYSRGLREVFK
jgi:predicted alpha/beta superfamily hydrolase